MIYAGLCERADYVEASMFAVLAFFVMFAVTGGRTRRPALSWPASALAAICTWAGFLLVACVQVI